MSDLRHRLSTRDPGLAKILDKLTDCELDNLSSAISILDDELKALRETYEAAHIEIGLQYGGRNHVSPEESAFNLLGSL